MRNPAYDSARYPRPVLLNQWDNPQGWPDVEVCSRCDHDTHGHAPGGCQLLSCPCSAEPLPYDPADDERPDAPEVDF